MINFSELKAGDIVLAKYEGQVMEGRILQVDREARQVCVLTHEDQENWYAPEDLTPVPLTDEQLTKLKFKRTDEALVNGNSQTYVRGPFTIMLGNGHTTLHYRNETRQINGSLMVHQLQNHYHGMTLFHLD